MKKNITLSLLTGISLTLAFPPFKLGFLAYGALIPFFLLLDEKNTKECFRWGYIVGLYSCIGVLFWIAWVTLPGAIGAILVLPLYFSIYAGVHNWLQRRLGPRFIVAVPFLWTGLEYVKSLDQIGFPWMSLGYTQTYYLPFIQHASITSVYGVSFWIVVLNVLLYQMYRFRCYPKLLITYVFVAALVFIIPLAHGLLQLSVLPSYSSDVRIALIQGNIDPFLKWKIEFKEDNFSTYERLTRKAAEQEPELYVWPETAVPSYLLYDATYLSRIRNLVDSTGVSLLSGSMNYSFVNENEYEYFNSAILVEPHKRRIQTYAKIQLVPFSERVPYEDSFPFKAVKSLLSYLEMGEGDFSRGKRITVMSFDRLKNDAANKSQKQQPEFKEHIQFAVVICYESIFPELVRQFVQKGAEFLVVITNDAWFGKTTAPFQHTQIAVFRAIENRIAIARCANTGISMFIDPFGRIQLPTDWFEEAIVVNNIPLRSEETFYSRHGNIFTVVASLTNLLFLVLAIVSKRQ
jgi:apolipoprotein N-acyltransferase